MLTKYVVDPDGCWIWTGYKTGYGYGQFGRGILAHRASWEEHRGPIPAGMFVCHKCDVPSCINPDHLFLGTHLDNMRDMFAKGRNPVIDVRGTKNPRAKLNERDVIAIMADQRPNKLIAADFGVTNAAIWLIKTGRNWSSVTQGSE